nr:PAS domain S-box protein [Nocardioides perillae]
MLEHSPDAHLVVSAEGEVLHVNAAAETLLGRSRGELVGSSVLALLPERLVERVELGLGRYLADPVAVPMDGTHGGGLALLRADGSEVAVDVSTTPVRDAAGRTVLGIGLRDAARRQSTGTLFRDLLEAAPDAMVIVDADGQVVLVNEQAERMFGWSRAELVGQPVEVLVPHRFRGGHPERRGTFSRAATHRPMGDEQLFALRRDGTQFPADISLSPLATGDGVLFSAAVRDVSDRQRVRDETDRIRDELIATVSHELRTPLTSILGYTELLADLDDDELGPVARQMLSVVQRNATRELNLVNDLLTVASVHAEQLALDREPVDLGSVVAGAVESARPLLTDAGLELVVDLDAVPPVAGDPRRLGQLLDNLLTNAAKFTPRGGSIRVQLGRDEDEVLVRVSDTGVGMSEQETRLVFERLYRAPSAVSSHVQGAGLGLSIVRAVVEAHGGRVEVASTPGEGSTFSVWLPVPAA